MTNANCCVSQKPESYFTKFDLASPGIVTDFLFAAESVTSTYAATVGIAYGTLSENNALQNKTTLNDSYVFLKDLSAVKNLAKSDHQRGIATKLWTNP